MTATSTVTGLAPRSEREASSSPALAGLALGRAEARRLLRHPAHLAGLAMSAVFLLVAQDVIGTSRDVPIQVIAGLGTFPLAAGTFVATFTATIRSRRHGTDELYATQPVATAVRTTGHLLAVGAGLATSLVLLGISAVRHALWDGVLVHTPDGVVPMVPSIAELAAGPVTVVLLGVAGVAVARLVPSLLAIPVAAVVLLFHFVTGSWGVSSDLQWFLPLVNHGREVGWVQVVPGRGYSIIDGFERTALAWHHLYLLGLTSLLAATALLRHGRTRTRLLLGGAGLCLALLAGALQVP